MFYLMSNLNNQFMSEIIKYALGADISKDELHVCLSALDSGQKVTVKGSRKFNNSTAGHRELTSWLSRKLKGDAPLSIAVEATGVYHEELSLFLQEKGYRLSVVLPNRALHYMRSIGLKSKNDKTDSQGLAHMAARQDLEPWSPASRYYMELRQLTRYHQSLQESRTVTVNQLHALEHSGYTSREVVRQLKRSLKLVDDQIKKMVKAIDGHVASDPDVSRKVGQICRIKGLGVLTVATVLAETGGFALFRNQRQLVSYAGYDVVENQSGKHVGKTSISKRGNSRIRRILHMGALVTVTCEQEPFASLHERIFDRTQIKMKAYVAVQKKLLVMIYTLWKRDEEFIDPSTVDETGAPEETFGDREQRPLFPVSRKGLAAMQINSPAQGGATQDGLPSNRSQEALFPVIQT